MPHFCALEELDELERALAGEQNVCIVAEGMGGIGKTVLAQQYVATRCKGSFRDGVAWLDADQLTADLARVATRFGWTGQQDPTPEQAMEHLGHWLYDRRVLLVVDNVAPNVSDLKHVPVPGGQSRTLLTSRDVLLGEKLGTSFKALSLDCWSLERCRSYLREVVPRLGEEPDNSIDDVSEFVGRLPLAVRLLTMHLKRRRDLGCSTLLQKLHSTPLGTLERYAEDSSNGFNRGVVATFLQAYEGLGANEQRVLQTLSVCARSTRSEIVATVAGIPLEQAGEALNSLCDVSLAQHVEGAEAPWRLHDVVRLFVSEQPGRTQLEDAHCLWVAQHCQRYSAPEQHVEFEQGLNEAIVAVGRMATRGDLIGASKALEPVFRHGLQVGSVSECAELIESVLAKAPPEGGVFALWLGNLGICCEVLGDIPKAIDLLQQSLARHAEHGYIAGQAGRLGSLGNCFLTLGDIPKATEHYARALALNQRLGSVGGEATTLNGLAMCHLVVGDTGKAIDVLTQALVLHVTLGSVEGQASALGNLGNCYTTQGNIPKAVEHYERSLELEATVGNMLGQATGLGNLGLCYRKLGEIQKAVDSLERALTLNEHIGNIEGQANSLGNLGLCFQTRRDLVKAIGFHRRSLALHQKLGSAEGKAANLSNLGLCYEALGDLPRAIEHLELSLALYEQVGSIEGQANQLGALGMIYANQLQIAAAEEALRRAAALYRQLGLKDDVEPLATVLEALKDL